MDRRQFLANAGALVLAGPALAGTLPVPPSERIAFKVFRNGTAVGTHELVFTQDGDNLTVLTNMAFVVTIAGIPIYHYHLVATEKWSGGVFRSVESKVNNNGTRLEVQAHQTASGYEVVDINHHNPAKSYPEYTAPPNTVPLTYWNKAMLNGTILNVDTAHSYPPIVSTPGGTAADREWRFDCGATFRCDGQAAFERVVRPDGAMVRPAVQSAGELELRKNRLSWRERGGSIARCARNDGGYSGAW